VIQTLLDEGKKMRVDHHNVKQIHGLTPLFCTRSAPAVEMFLAADLEGLELVMEDGMALLHHCVYEKDILTDSILDALQNQREMKHAGRSPLELGEHIDSFEEA
jgi:hypothetical protein